MYKDLVISVFDKLKKLGIKYKILEDEKLYISFLIESGYLNKHHLKILKRLNNYGDVYKYPVSGYKFQFTVCYPLYLFQ